MSQKPGKSNNSNEPVINAIVHHDSLDLEIAFIKRPVKLSDLLRKLQDR
jgi:hypothetical protein